MNYTVYNPDFKELVEEYLGRQHFMKHIGFELDVIEAGRTEGWLKIEEIHKQQRGFAHGGLVATLADVTAGFAAYTLVPPGHGVVTGELKVSYFNPGVGEKLHAIGWVIKQGRKINFCEAEVWDIRGEESILMAKATTSMITIFPEEQKGN
ncbi:MAG: PaaI family thioesterase [Bacteroidota bacterium]